MFTATSWRSIASSPSTGIILENARTKGCNRVIGRIFEKRIQEAQGRQRRGQKVAARCRGRRGAQGREESGEDTGVGINAASRALLRCPFLTMSHENASLDHLYFVTTSRWNHTHSLPDYLCFAKKRYTTRCLPPWTPPQHKSSSWIPCMQPIDVPTWIHA